MEQDELCGSGSWEVHLRDTPSSCGLPCSSWLLTPSTGSSLTRTAGTTHATYEVLNRFTEGHDPDIVLLAGDHT